MIYGNVPNRGVITNLPEGCCVEAPCPHRWHRHSPVRRGRAAAAVRGTESGDDQRSGARSRSRATGNREHVYHAIMLDPLTAAVLTLPQIRAMVDDLFAAEAAWLPDFSPAAA